MATAPGELQRELVRTRALLGMNSAERVRLRELLAEIGVLD